MNLSKLTTSDLLNYSTILENIVATNREIQREMLQAVSGDFCTKKEIEKIHAKSVSALEEADNIYSQVQKELDMRVKKDLGMKFGVTRSQSIIKEFDMFVHNRQMDLDAAAARRISKETVNNLSIVEDDNP